jgi:hypothetical protein
MKSLMHQPWLLSLPLAGLLIGCGKPAGTGNAPNVTAGISKTLPAVGRELAMKELRDLSTYYFSYVDTAKHGPAKLEDLQDLKKDLPSLYQALADGRYVVIWNARPDGLSRTVLAYDKDTPAKGGVALLGDGSVKQLSVAEFQAAMKGK